MTDMNANFAQLKVPDLKKYLQRRGIPVSNKRREELLDLSIKAHELGASKILTKDGTLPEPYLLKSD